MKIAINYRKGNLRLKEGIESAGHEVIDNIWDINSIVSERINAVIFEFKYIFKEKWKFLSLIYRLKRHGIPVITWNVDSPWNAGIRKWKVNLLLRSNILSLYATHSLQDTDWTKHTRTIYLPNAAWISKYNLRSATLEDLRRPNIYKWDVFFIGNMDKERYREHENRVEFLERIGRFLTKKGINFLFADGKDLSFDEQVEIIQRSKINLSCLSAADSVYGKSWGLPERCYGIPACGGFLLMDDRVHIKDDFSIGDEVVTYSDIEDCKNKIFYYLDKHEERRRIAERAYQKVMKEHTYMHRARKLISEIQNLKNNVNFQTN
ncbi:MAG: glycosyltransferase [Nitrospirota bacterium]